MLNKTVKLVTDRLKHALKVRGWDAQELSDATGISRSGLYNILRGDRWPSADNLDRIVDALEMPLWQLVYDGDPNATEAPIASPIPPEPLEERTAIQYVRETLGVILLYVQDLEAAKLACMLIKKFDSDLRDARAKERKQGNKAPSKRYVTPGTLVMEEESSAPGARNNHKTGT